LSPAQKKVCPNAQTSADRVTQQQLHTIDEYFPLLPAGTANQ
jgi:hypothetical protein